jgi:hypothetical protein
MRCGRTPALNKSCGIFPRVWSAVVCVSWHGERRTQTVNGISSGPTVVREQNPSLRDQVDSNGKATWARRLPFLGLT